MIIAYIYQFSDGSFQDVRIRAALNKYLKETEKVFNNTAQIVCRWVVKKKK